MGDTGSGTQLKIGSMILIPAVITLAITLLRLAGEFQHWSTAFFNASAGGAGAIVGIVWLPFIFGPYFAAKWAGAGEGPSSAGKALGFALLGILITVGGGFISFAPKPQFPGKMIVGLLFMAGAAAIQFPAWPALTKTLLAYAYAARIPVAIVMFFAIRGNWGTHYDVLPPNYTGPTDFWGKYLFIGLVPQLIFWVVYTILVGALAGSITAMARRGKPAAQAAS